MKPTLRTYTLIGILMAIGITVAFSISHRRTPTLQQAVKEHIEKSKKTTYTDKMFGFYVDYPVFFDVDLDSMADYQSYFKASYWVQDVHIILQSYATVHTPLDHENRLTIPAPMRIDERFLDGMTDDALSDTLTIDMPLPQQEDYIYHAKCVKRQRTWFVQSLIYPKAYAKSVELLLRRIDAWQVWNEFQPTGKAE